MNPISFVWRLFWGSLAMATFFVTCVFVGIAHGPKTAVEVWRDVM